MAVQRTGGQFAGYLRIGTRWEQNQTALNSRRPGNFPEHCGVCPEEFRSRLYSNYKRTARICGTSVGRERGMTTKQAQKFSLETKRVLKAPRERVYAAWTNPAHLREWFGPEGVQTRNLIAECRV